MSTPRSGARMANKKLCSVQKSDFTETHVRGAATEPLCVWGTIVVPRQSVIPHSAPTQLGAFTCWVLRAGSMPSDWHTRLSSPVSAPESSHASQPQPTAFYAARRKYLGQPGQSLQFERRWGKRQSDYRKPALQMVELICESQDCKTDPLQPICTVQDKGKPCSSPELKQWIRDYVTACSGYHRAGWTEPLLQVYL